MSNKDQKDKTLVDTKEEVRLDPRIWMRPKDACDYLNERGFNVSASLMYYWRKEEKIVERELENLGGLKVVDVRTAPEEMRSSRKLTLRKKEQDK